METKYKHSIAILKNEVLLIEVNENEKPILDQPDISSQYYASQLNELQYWESKLKYFQFGNKEDENILHRMFLESALIKGIGIDFSFFQIKDNLAYYKDPNEHKKYQTENLTGIDLFIKEIENKFNSYNYLNPSNKLTMLEVIEHLEKNKSKFK